MIEIEFVGTRTLWGSIIKWGTMSDIDHVQFVLADGRRLGAMPGAGVTFGPPPPADATVHRYGLDASPEVLAYAYSQIGKPYDLGAVLAIAARMTLGHDWRRADKWFCSELVAACFSIAGRPLISASDLCVITPRDLTLSPYLIPLDRIAA